jgi:hypothetical protein
MVTHSLQLSNIFSSLTSINGGYFPNNPNANSLASAAPRYHVKQIKVPEKGSEHYQDEWFTVTLQCTSETELETYIKAFQNCGTQRPSGWHSVPSQLLLSYSIPIAAATDNDEVEAVNATMIPYSLTTPGATSLGIGSLDWGNVRGLQLTFTVPATYTLVTGKLYIYLMSGSGAVTIAVWEVSMDTPFAQTGVELDIVDQSVAIGGTFTTPAWFTETSANDFMDIYTAYKVLYPTATVIPVFIVGNGETVRCYDAGNSNPGYYPKIVGTYSPSSVSDYPYYLDVKLHEKNPTNGVWEATLRVNARWTL